MKLTFRVFSFCLLALALLFQVKAQDTANSTSVIKTENGILVVSNSDQTNFAVEFKGKEFKPLETENVAFVVDGRVVQIVQVPHSDFVKPPQKNSSEQELLVLHRDWESNYLSGQFGEKLSVKSENITLGGSRQALFWEYATPAKFNSDFSSQLFLTTVVGKKVLGINVPLEKKDSKNSAREYMTQSLLTLKFSAKPFDINAIAEKIKQGKSPF